MLTTPPPFFNNTKATTTWYQPYNNTNALTSWAQLKLRGYHRTTPLPALLPALRCAGNPHPQVPRWLTSSQRYDTTLTLPLIHNVFSTSSPSQPHSSHKTRIPHATTSHKANTSHKLHTQYNDIYTQRSSHMANIQIHPKSHIPGVLNNNLPAPQSLSQLHKFHFLSGQTLYTTSDTIPTHANFTQETPQATFFPTYSTISSPPYTYSYTHTTSFDNTSGHHQPNRFPTPPSFQRPLHPPCKSHIPSDPSHYTNLNIPLPHTPLSPYLVTHCPHKLIFHHHATHHIPTHTHLPQSHTTSQYQKSTHTLTSRSGLVAADVRLLACLPTPHTPAYHIVKTPTNRPPKYLSYPSFAVYARTQSSHPDRHPTHHPN